MGGGLERRLQRPRDHVRPERRQESCQAASEERKRPARPSPLRSSDALLLRSKFAFPITTGMSFNRTLWQVTGRQIGHEARALMNAGQAGSTYWAPVINLAREPRWGRNIEVPGEDPYHTGEYAEYFVKGFEQAPEDPDHIQASAW